MVSLAGQRCAWLESLDIGARQSRRAGSLHSKILWVVCRGAVRAPGRKGQSGTRRMTTGNSTLDTFPKLLLHHARERGERPAIREKSRGIWRTVTWRELAEEAAALAAAASARGLQRGAHVALLGDNRPRMYAAMCAAQWLGAVALPLYQDANGGGDRLRQSRSRKLPTSLPKIRSRSTSCLSILPRCSTPFDASSTTRIAVCGTTSSRNWSAMTRC